MLTCSTSETDVQLLPLTLLVLANPVKAQIADNLVASAFLPSSANPN